MSSKREEFRIGDYWLSRHATSPRWQRTWFDKDSRQTKRASLGPGTEVFQNAKVKLTEWFYANHRPVAAKPEEVSLSLVLKDYYDGHASKLASAGQALIACGHLEAFFGAAVISDLTPAKQEAYIEFRRSREIADGTIARELANLRAAIRRGWKRGELIAAPFIMDPEDTEAKHNKDPKGRPLSHDEMRAFFAAGHQHGQMMLMILINTMCRPGAALDITAAMRDRQHDLIYLNPPGRKVTRKRRPVVPLTKTLKLWFDRHEEAMKAKAEERLGTYDPAKDFYVTYFGRRIKSTRTLMRRMRIDAGLVLRDETGAPLLDDEGEQVGDPDVNWYSIRHTVGRELRRRRVPKDEISLMLGHMPVDVKRIDLVYSPFDPDYCRATAAAIDDYVAELRVTCV